MNIESMDDFFNQLTNSNKAKNFYRPVLGVGNAKTIKEFYDKIVKPTLPKKETVIAWDNLLNHYIKMEDKILFIRRYGSSVKKNGQYDIRRGFLTQYSDGFRYVFVDNYFPQIIYLMAINNFVPEEQDFKEFIVNFKMPYGFRADKSEKPYQTFSTCKDVGLNRNHWKHSHMFSANNINDDYTFDFDAEKMILFPKGKYEDWNITDEKKKAGFSYPIRLLNSNLTKEQKEKISAHFLRVIHPINYFLTPGIKWHSSAVCNDIGEYPPFIQYVYLQLEKEYGEVISNFKSKVMGKMVISKTEEELGNEVIDITYGTCNNKQTKCKSKYNVSNENQAKCLYEYLFNGLSLEKIEKKVLSKNLKGWTAMNIRNSFNLTAEHKKCLYEKSLDSLDSSKLDENLQKSVDFIKIFLSPT